MGFIGEHVFESDSPLSIRDITDNELLNELNENADYGKRIINAVSDSDISIITMIYEMLNDHKMIRRRAKDYHDDITGIAIGLSVLWGNIVCSKYQWNWREIFFNNDENQIITCIVSPQERYYIDPIRLFNDICHKKAENDTLLLFNLLDGVENKYPESDRPIELI